MKREVFDSVLMIIYVIIIALFGFGCRKQGELSAIQKIQDNSIITRVENTIVVDPQELDAVFFWQLP